MQPVMRLVLPATNRPHRRCNTRRVHRLRFGSGIPIQLRSVLRIGIQRKRDSRVTGSATHDLRMHTRTKSNRRVAVPHIVQRN